MGHAMDRHVEQLRKDIAQLEAELEVLFNTPAVPPGKRGELMDRLRLLKAKLGHGSSESSPSA